MKPYYSHAGITIYHGDCLAVMHEADISSIGCVVADPPYSSGTRQSANRKASPVPAKMVRWAPEQSGIVWDSSFSSFGLWWFLIEVMRGMKPSLLDGSHLYLFSDWRHYPLVSLALEAAGFFANNLIVWDKESYAMGGNYRSQHELITFASHGSAERLARADRGNVIRCKRERNGDHPTQKPVALIRTILESCAAEVILDPFAGAGSTLVAAKAMGRQCVGIEIDERYCEVAAKRLSQESLGLGDVA